MKYSTVREISEPVDGNTTICKVHFTWIQETSTSWVSAILPG
jgi:hypothetical protein